MSHSYKKSPGRVKACTVPVKSLSRVDHEQMYTLMQKYYENMDWNTFLRDLSQKDQVILVKRATDGFIVGFSTLKDIMTHTAKGIVRGVFSGDTIVDREYWGNRVLPREFTKALVFKRLKNPFRPFYWFLISKGYKTYMLMANNCPNHYPRYEKTTPNHEQEVMDRVYSTMFPDYYDQQSGLVRYHGPSCRLKATVAPITDSLLEKNKRIAFFHKANPEWQIGSDMACLADFTLTTFALYQLKFLRMRLMKTLRRLVFLPEKVKS